MVLKSRRYVVRRYGVKVQTLVSISNPATNLGLGPALGPALVVTVAITEVVVTAATGARRTAAGAGSAGRVLVLILPVIAASTPFSPSANTSDVARTNARLDGGSRRALEFGDHLIRLTIKLKDGYFLFLLICSILPSRPHLPG